MTDYDLNRLNDKEFEVLAAQIVSLITGRKIERFKPGKDKGVDGRFFVAGSAEAIMQAKHWQRSGFAALLAYLTKKEAPKVERLKPSRYIFVTSVPLSRANKQAIKELFAPYLLCSGYVQEVGAMLFSGNLDSKVLSLSSRHRWVS